MPRLDDPNVKLKKKKPFVRKSLRPWDDPDNFIPHQTVNVESDYCSTEQKVNNKETKGKQKVNNKVNNKETKGKQNASEIIKTKQEYLSTDHDKTLTAITGLFGLQKKALFSIVENCKSRGLLYTSPMTNEFFRTALNTDINSVKTTIQRLINKGFTYRKASKKGKGGYTIFSINSIVRSAAIEAFKQLDMYSEQDWSLNSNRETIDKQKVNNKVNNTLCSSSSSNYLTTTTENLDIPIVWQNIDLQALELIKFSQHHLLQIYREYEKNPNIALSPETIQESINALAFDLKHNNVSSDFKKPMAVVLTSLLRRGQPYTSKTPEKYITPREEALIAHREMLRQQHARQEQLTSEIKKLELEEWQNNLPEDELLEFCPDVEIAEGIPKKLRKTIRKRKALDFSKDYFDTEIWPNKLKIINQQAEVAVKQNQEETNENQ